MFKVGDKIVYPMYGAGIVSDIETEETGVHYVIRIPKGNLKIKVAVSKNDKIGVRPVSDESEIMKAIELVLSIPVAIQSNWSIRYKENLEKIRGGRLCDVVEVARNLMLRERERGLSSAEKKMLNSAKQIAVSEIAFAKGIDFQFAEDFLANKLLY